MKADALKLQQDKGWKAMCMAVGATVRCVLATSFPARRRMPETHRSSDALLPVDGRDMP